MGKLLGQFPICVNSYGDRRFLNRLVTLSTRFLLPFDDPKDRTAKAYPPKHPATMSSTHPPYVLCSTPTDVTNAVAVLALSEYLVLDCEGKSIGNNDGILSLVCIGTARSENIFIFDTLALTYAEPAMAPLLNLLKSDQVRKVVWDGRQDFLEIMDNYGVNLGGVLDLQLAEVTSRSAVRGENERKRLLRLSSGYLSYKLVKEKKKELNGIHLVIGLQKCLEQTQLENVIGKDKEVVAMHKENGGVSWLERPLSPRLMQYAANDIYVIDLLYSHFLQKNWIKPISLPLLLAQSKRYVSTQWLQGRTDRSNVFRLGALLPLDVLTNPQGRRERCSGCEMMLSLSCFEHMRQAGMLRKPRCRLCNVIAAKRRLPPDEGWIRVGSGESVKT